MTHRPLSLFVTALAALSSAAWAQAPILLKDANATPSEFGSTFSIDNPTGNVRNPDTAPGSAGVRLPLPSPRTLVVAKTDATGHELFSNFGDRGTIAIVRDIYPGPGDSMPGGFFVYNGDAYFWATAVGTGRELWRSDGTFAGTNLVADVVPGSGSAGLAYGPTDAAIHVDQGTMAELNGKLYFLAHGARGLYETDGTSVGTVLIKAFAELELDPNAGQALGDKETFRQLVVANGKLFFKADDGLGAGSELWCSDGTSAGTTIVQDINPGPSGSDPAGLFSDGAKVWFRADDGATGVEPWTSDGTAAGTNLLLDINPESSEPTEFTQLGGLVVFQAIGAGSFFGDLFASDGTPGGTINLRVNGEMLHAVGGVVLAKDGLDLVRTDGTRAGTNVLVSGINPFTFSEEIAGRVYFTASGPGGRELWCSDGTVAGTNEVMDINPTGDSNPLHHLPALHPSAGLNGMLFVANDGVHGYEYWSTDGTAAGTFFIGELSPSNPAATEDGATSRGAVLGNRLFFIANDAATGFELWSTDGTPAGTNLFFDFAPGPNSGFPTGFRVAKDKMFFEADDRVNGDELWVTDGTVAGTGLVQDINPGSRNGANLNNAATVNGRILFEGDTPAEGRELWVSDGTAAGTNLVLDINPGSPDGLRGLAMTSLGDLVFFEADDGVHGLELWMTDGTQGGTSIAADINPGGNGVRLSVKCAVGDHLLFFAGDDGTTGSEPWVYDTNTATATLLADIMPGAESSVPGPLVAVGDLCYFWANDGVHGFELWVSDGTPAGTNLVIDLNPGEDSAWENSTRAFMVPEGDARIVDYFGQCLFFGNDGTHGVELFTTNGTAAGTSLVKDIEPGPFGSDAFTAMHFGGRWVYFRARTSMEGYELWRTDGTAAGTRIVSDANPGPLGSFSGYDPSLGLWALNDRLIAPMLSPVFGEELFAIRVGALARNAGFATATGNYWRREGLFGKKDGHGCKALGAVAPILTADDPVLGSNVRWRVSRADANAPGTILFGLPSARPVAFPTPSGDCLFWLGLFITGFPFATDANGEFSSPVVPVPVIPGAIGLSLASQAAVFGPSGVQGFGFAGSNAVIQATGL